MNDSTRLFHRGGWALTLLLGATLLTSAAPRVLPSTFSIQDEKKFTPRLPNYWRDLELTNIQVKKIYELQEEANEKIKPLEKQIEALKEKLDKDMRDVLRSTQVDALAKIEGDTKLQREIRSKITALSNECDDWLKEAKAATVTKADIADFLESVRAIPTEISKLKDSEDKRKYGMMYSPLKKKADELEGLTK